MKMYKLYAVILLAISIAIAGDGLFSRKTNQSTTEITIQIPSVKSDMCKTRLEDGLGKLKGVNSVNIDLAAQTGTVEFNPKKVTENEITATIEKLGHRVGISENSTDCSNRHAKKSRRCVDKSDEKTDGCSGHDSSAKQNCGRARQCGESTEGCKKS